MPITRRFLIASPLARLVRRERAGTQVTEGYFPAQPRRNAHVSVDNDQTTLVLTVTDPGGGEVDEERTDIPRAHAAALLDVVAGRVDYDRTQLSVSGCAIDLEQFVTPGPVNLVTIRFASEEEAQAFRILPWFGPEVSGDHNYRNPSMALAGLPGLVDVPITAAALDSLLDALEGEAQAPRASSAVASEAPSAPEVRSSDGGEQGSGAHGEDEVIREPARALRPRAANSTAVAL